MLRYVGDESHVIPRDGIGVCGIPAVTVTTLVSNQICRIDIRKTECFSICFTQTAAVWILDWSWDLTLLLCIDEWTVKL